MGEVETLTDRLMRLIAERDTARAEAERLKAELDSAKEQARSYRQLYDFETCTGCSDPECGLCGQ